MSDAEIDSFLQEQGTGVLSLADGNDAYAVPISFGYERGRIVFAYYHFGSDSRKLAYSEATERACLATYEATSGTDWKSVLAFGPLTELDAAQLGEVGRLIADNAWSPDLSAVGERRYSITPYELTVEDATGRNGIDPADR